MLDYTFKFVRDRSEVGEFFLEIASASAQSKQAAASSDKVRRRICIIDIEEIEPIQGTKFQLKYHS